MLKHFDYMRELNSFKINFQLLVSIKFLVTIQLWTTITKKSMQEY